MNPNNSFATHASDADIERTKTALEKNGMTVIVAPDGKMAKEEVFKLIPPGAEVFTMTSVTLETIGIAKEINESGKFDSVRSKLMAMDRAIAGADMAKLGAAPAWAVGSVHAVTHEGNVMIASNSGSQLPAYASAAQNVIWVVGSQKLVKDIDEGFRRIYEYSLPLESERAQKAYGIQSNVSKVLIVNKEIRRGRITVIIVKEKLGF